MVSSIRMWFFGLICPVETHLYCSKQKKRFVKSPSKWGHQPHFSWSRWRVTLNVDCCRSLSNTRIISIRLWSHDHVDWSDMGSVSFTGFEWIICCDFLNGIFLSIEHAVKVPWKVHKHATEWILIVYLHLTACDEVLVYWLDV